MVWTGTAAQALQPQTPTFGVTFHPWAERYKEEIAHLMAAAYRGHVDSDINDQYRTIPGARHFLMNIIQFPGCGAFPRKRLWWPWTTAAGAFAEHVFPARYRRIQDTLLSCAHCRLFAARGLGMNCCGNRCCRRWILGVKRLALPLRQKTRKRWGFIRSMGFHTSSQFPALVWEGF